MPPTIAATYLAPGSAPEHAQIVDSDTIRVLAGPARRTIARVIDWVAFIAAGGGIGLLASWITDVADSLIPLIASFSLMIPLAVYRIWVVGLWGRTLGQAIAGIHIVQFHDGRSKPTWSQAWKRWTDGKKDSLQLVNDIVDFTSDRATTQCSHDHNAGTTVVRYLTPRAGSYQASPTSHRRGTIYRWAATVIFGSTLLAEVVGLILIMRDS